jgi:sugar/nucleoside kinase (ribokinase family)
MAGTQAAHRQAIESDDAAWAAYGGHSGTGVFGERARRVLEQAGITALLPPDERADTGLVVGLVEPDGERTFVTAPGTESRLAPRDLRALPLRAGDAVYVSGYDLVYPVSGQSLQALTSASSIRT